MQYERPRSVRTIEQFLPLNKETTWSLAVLPEAKTDAPSATKNVPQAANAKDMDKTNAS